MRAGGLRRRERRASRLRRRERRALAEGRTEPQPRRRAPAEGAAPRANGLRRRERRPEGADCGCAEGSGGGSRGCGELRWRERRKGSAEAAHNREKG
ncbi:hypothetical protein GUJ93_ZPchr0002g26799 [Zizania palustris]|uniref:Uncharacterized protein n=1 Tax=Zizania palustris TaxID=103762 RepID=A0A8J5S6W6_ZIZPA|nr:hypothetical protein GUJ93_ZPchr0002g26799 [Zizania palustris]